jgi:hypothetical protein
VSFLYAGEFLNAVEIESIADTLDNLHSEWTRRAPEPMPIYTMGAATYLDARHNSATYKKSARQKNGILQEHFDWLYSRLIEKISVQFGPAVLEPELALPGFHIFGEHRGRPLPPLLCRFLENTPASVHIDTPYKNHLVHWLKYSEFDFLHPLSITVCIELPQHGAGLNMWDRLKSEVFFHGHRVIDEKFDRGQLPHPTYHPYTSGWMYASSGHQVHQIAPSKNFLPQDRRITLQMHAIRCDGWWRIFF